MKRCKRQLSICIVLAMLIGLLVYPSAVSAQTPLAFEDFEGESNKLGADCTNEEFEGHKAGRVAKGKSAILDFEDVSGRGVKISFDAYLKLQSGSNVNGTVVATSSDGTEDFNLVQVFQRRIRMTTGDDWPDMYTAEENGWHHIELVANLDGGTVATSVYNMNGELLAEQKYSVGCKSIGKLSFASAGSMDLYLDNVNAETCEVEAVQGVLAEEDFEGESNKLGDDCTNEEFEGHNAGKVSQTSASIDFEDVFSGGVLVSFDAYMHGETGKNVNTTVIVTSAEGTELGTLQMFQHRVRYATGDQANIYAKDNGWHHIKQLLNLEDGSVKTWVFDMNGNLLAEGVEAIGVESASMITFDSISKNMDFYFDNLKIETCDTAYSPEKSDGPSGDDPIVPDNPNRPDVYLSEDFEGGSNGFSANCSNVEFEGVEGRVGAIAYNPAGSGQYMSNVEFTDINGGGAKISYDLYLVGGQSHYVKAFPTSGKEYPLLQISGLGIGLTNGGASFCTALTKGWVHIEQYMKLDLGEVRTYVYAQDGSLLGEASNNIGYNSIASITFCNWSAGQKLNLYIDNLKVENYNPPPELSYNSFVVKDYAGNVISETSGVTPGIGTVAIDFGTKMKAETLNGIIIQKADGKEIKATGKLNGSVYTLTLSQGLETGSKYKIVVPATVASIEDVTLGSRFTYEFATGKGETSAVVTGITKSGVEVKKFSQLAKDDKIVLNVAYGNTTEKELPVTFVVAYYSGKSIAKFDVHTVSVPAGFGMMTQEVTVPALDGVDQIKVVALNGLYSMVAYHLPMIIK